MFLPFTENRLKPNKDSYCLRAGVVLAHTSFFLCSRPTCCVVVGPCTWTLFAQAECEVPQWEPNCKLLTCHLFADKAHSWCLGIFSLQGKYTRLPNRRSFMYEAIQARFWKAFHRSGSFIGNCFLILYGKAVALFSVVLCKTCARPAEPRSGLVSSVTLSQARQAPLSKPWQLCGSLV